MFAILKRPQQTLVLLLALSLIFLAACQPGAPAQQASSCPQSAEPQITRLSPGQASQQAVYFTSRAYLYALNAGNGAFRWCREVQGSAADAAQGYQHSVLSSLTLSAGRLYVNAYDGNLDVFDAASGALLWQYPTKMDGLGPNPTVAGDIVYSGSSVLYALDAQHGNVLWQYAMEGPAGSPAKPDAASWGNPSSTRPVVSGGTLFFGSTFDEGQNAGSISFLHALDARSGKKLWVVPERPSANFELAGDPVVEQGKVLALVNGVVTAFDARTGRQLWRWGESAQGLSMLGGADGLLYVVEQTRYVNAEPVNHPRMYALDVGTGRPRWSVAAIDDASRFHTLASGDLFYVAAAGAIYAYNSRDGSVRWHTQVAIDGVGMTGPILAHGELYIGAQGPGHVLLHALNAQSGVENWYATVPGTSLAGQVDVAGE